MARVTILNCFLSSLLISLVSIGISECTEIDEGKASHVGDDNHDEGAFHVRDIYESIENKELMHYLGAESSCKIETNHDLSSKIEKPPRLCIRTGGDYSKEDIQTGIAHSIRSSHGKIGSSAIDFDKSKTYKLDSKYHQDCCIRYEQFEFKTYSPIAFEALRDLYGLTESIYLDSISNSELREIINPAQSGSFLFITHDSKCLIKTANKGEVKILLKTLPEYYNYLNSHPNSLLPRFFGIHYLSEKNFLTSTYMIVTNFLYPTSIKLELKYDLKGSTVNRKVSVVERAKSSPTFRDVNFMEQQPEGFSLEPEVYIPLMSSLEKDVRFLRREGLIDYSLFIGVHHLDKSYSIYSDYTKINEQNLWSGIVATNGKGEKVLLFIGIIDILTLYSAKRVLENAWKSLFHAAHTTTIQNPEIYANRLKKFISNRVFKCLKCQADIASKLEVDQDDSDQVDL